MKIKIKYWKEPDGKFLGYLNEYPDPWTQGEDFDDLKEHLKVSSSGLTFFISCGFF